MNRNSVKNPFTAIMPIAHRPDVVFVRGEGSWLTDSEGNRYLDFAQGWAVNALGHSHPAVVQALQQQVARLISASPAFYNQPMVDLSGLLVANSAFDGVFFTNSGAEANEGGGRREVPNHDCASDSFRYVGPNYATGMTCCERKHSCAESGF